MSKKTSLAVAVGEPAARRIRLHPHLLVLRHARARGRPGDRLFLRLRLHLLVGLRHIGGVNDHGRHGESKRANDGSGQSFTNQGILHF